MKKTIACALCLFLLGLPLQAQLEGLLAQLIVPALSSVSNTVERGLLSTVDLVSNYSDASDFVEKNEAKLAFDISRGGGEYLDALADLMHVPKDDRAAWYKEMKKRYAQRGEIKG